MTEALLGFDVRLARSERSGASYFGCDPDGWPWPDSYDGRDFETLGWKGANSFLWDRYDDLTVHRFEEPIEHLAVTLVLRSIPRWESTLPRFGDARIHLDAARPDVLDALWKPLGYDVVDGFLSSGLVMFGMPPSLGHLERPRLLESVEDALDAQAHYARIAPEHAPFCVVRIDVR